MTIGSGPACRYTLADETGEVDLLFLGRVVVAGLEPGSRCSAEGTAADRDGRLVIWNPRYQLYPVDSPGAPATATMTSVMFRSGRRLALGTIRPAR